MRRGPAAGLNAWRPRLHAAITDISIDPPRSDLDELAEDIAWARHLLNAVDQG
jgi:hypothetical protein